MPPAFSFVVLVVCGALRMLEKLFGLKTEGVTAKSEILAGTTVFFTMAYILFVNPQILSAAGLHAVTVRATATAVPVRGIDGPLP